MLLRPRQSKFVDRSLAALCERGNTLSIASTGFGKTIALSAVVARSIAVSDAKACILAHRDELTAQNRSKFSRVAPEISTSVVDAKGKDWSGQATFAMVQTLTGPANLKAMPALDLLVIDEAHHARADSYRRIVDRAHSLNPACRIFGVTATPNRGDRKGLHKIFDNVGDQVHLDTGAPGPQEMPTFTLGELLDDQGPMPEDIIAPRVLTPGGLLVLGGAPKVGKSDLLISWLVHMAAGVPFPGFTPPRPLRIFYLQAEIQYHYLRERLKQIALPPEVLAAARDTFVATPKLKMLLDNEDSVQVARAVQTAFTDAPPDILCVDPIRNLFDGGPDGGGENDNTAMMFFLKERVEVLRDHIDPDCGVILIHHTKKLSKQQVKDEPFLALSGASALRGFYTSGLILHRPDEECSQRKLEIELRNGSALPPEGDRQGFGGQWVEINPMNERLVRQEVGAKHDAERDRKGEVICGLLYEEALQGRMYTMTHFAETFENTGGLGGQSIIRERLNVLTTKGYVKFVRGAAATALDLATERSKYGYLCVETMRLATSQEHVDPGTGEVLDPSVVEYSRKLQTLAAEELALLPDRSAIVEMMGDYTMMRDQAHACIST